MTILRGRCNNTEFCPTATSQKVVELPDDEPFICPQCSADLAPLPSRAAASGGKKLLLIQASVIVLGAAGIGYKMLIATPPAPRPGQEMDGTSAFVDSNTAVAPADPGVPTASAPPAPVAAAVPAPAATPSSAHATTTAAAPVQNASLVVPAAPPPPPPTIILRLNGSDVVGGKLARRLAAGYLALTGDSDIKAQPGAQPGTIDIVGTQAGQAEAIAITQSSTDAGFAALAHGQADVALSVRPVTSQESQALSSLGDMASPDAEHIAGVEAVAAIVNPSIRVGALSRAQLAGILGGKIHDWSEVGGAAGPIHAYVRDPQAGDFAAGVLFADPAQATGAQKLADDEAVSAAVSRDPGGIGLVDLAAAGGTHVLKVGEANAAMAPTEVVVATEDYPLTRRLYLYTASIDTTGGKNVARRFTDYVASPGGQAAVEAAGFVSLSVKTQKEAVPQDASARFRALVAGATRLTTTFRFQPGSTLLDSRARHDIDRLAAFLRTRHSDGAQLILAGFADNTGTAEVSDEVSQKRAAAVAAALAKAGVTPGKVVSFGPEVPVADNATAEGREKNRRVEAYLAP